jgi:hypothetical protein
MADRRRNGNTYGKKRRRVIEATAICHRMVRPDQEAVGVLYLPESESSAYRGLITCGSVWACPICSQKITEARRAELSKAVATCPYHLVMLTFTLQHTAGDSLPELLQALKAAYKRFFNGRAWAALAAELGVVGRVRSLEVTHGSNGWHPHIHVLLFLQRPIPIDTLKSTLQPRWATAVAKEGRYALTDYGLSVQGSNDVAAAYLAKMGLEDVTVPQEDSEGWTLTHELIKSSMKKARRGGRSPLQLVADYQVGDQEAGQLWLQYYWAFKGEKQLVWSKGLRALLGLDDELTDEEIAAQDENGILLAQLPRSQWAIVVANDARAELLNAAATGDPVIVCELLASIGIGGGADPPP